MNRTTKFCALTCTVFLLCLWIVFAAPTEAPAALASFQLSVVNTHQSIECQKLLLDRSRGAFKCKRGDITYKYKAEAIESVTHNGTVIYPYDTNLRLTEADLYNKDCDYLIKTIASPLLLEEDPELFILVGTMYENGICTRQNPQKAYSYYRRAGKYGRAKYTELRKKLN
jgi:TPR repeat protein